MKLPDAEEVALFRLKFDCPCGCGKNNTDDLFLNEILFAQGVAGFEFIITSGFRCQWHNDLVGGDKGSAALLGLHADIGYEGYHQCFRIIKALIGTGFERIRLYEKHVHVDKHPEGVGPGFWWCEYSKKSTQVN